MTPPVLVMAANYAHAAQWARGHGLRRRDDVLYVHDEHDLHGRTPELVVLDCARRHRRYGELIEYAIELQAIGGLAIRWERCG